MNSNLKRIKNSFRRFKDHSWSMLFWPKMDRYFIHMIRGKSVYVVGSGPSAKDLKTIPVDAVVMTCNLGPLILKDIGFDRRIDVYFAVASHPKKKVLIDRENHHKAALIYNCMSNCDIRALLINHWGFFRQSKKAKYQTLWYDGLRHKRYLNRILGKKSLRNYDIKEWTSTGIRLIQMALFYGAKDIVITGVDLGREGYVWGESLNPWKHLGVDEKVLKLMSERYDNIYCLTDATPAHHYFPTKE